LGSAAEGAFIGSLLLDRHRCGNWKGEGGE
jgi:hypothetical protein